MKTPVSTESAPFAIGHNSQGIKNQGTLYISGQIGIKPGDTEIVHTSISEQTDQVFANIMAILSEADASLGDILKLNIYLTNLSDFPLVNEIMAEYFSEPYPARAVVGVANLPKGAMIEMDAIMTI